MFKSVLTLTLCFLVSALPAQAQDTPIKVVATFSILGDMVRQVGGDDVSVTTLVGPEEDAHTFQPSPEDAKALINADIIAINGLGYEGWLHRLIKASGTKAKLLVASAGVRPRMLDGETAGTVTPDPHAWQDLRNGQLYVKNIAGALIEARPDKADNIKSRGRAYIAKLDKLDNAARASNATLAPQARPKIITNHDAFGYFAQAYGVTFLSPVGLSTEAEPSAAALAKLIEQIKTEKVKKLFLENMSDTRLIKQIAKDTDAEVGGTLYADALSKPDGEAPTYYDMMKVNITRILGAR